MSRKNIFFLLGCVGVCVGMTQGGFKKELWPVPLSGKEVFFKDHVTLSVKALTAEESEKYLKQDVLEWGYKPVQVTIENGSCDPYVLSPSSIDLPTVSASQVAKKVLKNSIARAVGFKIAGFIFFPFIVPGTIDSLMTHKNYRALKRGLSSKTVKEEIIAPYSVLQRVFFVPEEEYKEAFTVTLQNQETLVDQVFQVESEKKVPETLEPLPQVEENYYLTH